MLGQIVVATIREKADKDGNKYYTPLPNAITFKVIRYKTLKETKLAVLEMLPHECRHLVITIEHSTIGSRNG